MKRRTGGLGTKCGILTGSSDGNIRYFEYSNDEFIFLSEYKSGDPQRGIAFLPKRGVAVSQYMLSNLGKVSSKYADWYRSTKTRLCEHSRQLMTATLSRSPSLFLDG